MENQDPDHIATGKTGEDLAVAFLEAKGFIIFDRNYRYANGEIDIIALRENVLHFVEVKTRKNSSLNYPQITINKQKMAQLGRTGSFYIWERKLNNMPAVFDVLDVGLDDPDNPLFRHWENVLHPNNPYF